MSGGSASGNGLSRALDRKIRISAPGVPPNPALYLLRAGGLSPLCRGQEILRIAGARPNRFDRDLLRRPLRQTKRTAANRLFAYALRSAATLRWLWMRPGESIARMHFPTLMEECDPPTDLRKEVEDLMALKAVTRELGEGPLSPTVAAFIDHEFDRARTALETEDTRSTEEDIPGDA